MPITRGKFAFIVVLLAGILTAESRCASRLQAQETAPIGVLVWDEQQPAQKAAYEIFLGNQIAGFLGKQPGLKVVSRRHDDPDQGISDADLATCDVLVWWGHVRQREIRPEAGQRIVERI